MAALAAHLTARGLHVRPAPWWARDAVLVSLAPLQHDGLTVLDHATFVHPTADGIVVTQTRHGRDGDRRSRTVATADEAAALLIRLVEAGSAELWA